VNFVFDINKTVAAAGLLAKEEGGSIELFVLIKKLYGAEREALAQWHRPITGDSFASLPKGPILSRTYNLIKGEILKSNSDMATWSQHFSPRVGNVVQLIAEPDFDFLSQREVDALKKSSREINDLIKNHGRIADELHKLWPEWKNPTDHCGQKSMPLSAEEVLSEVIEDESECDRALVEISAVSSAKAALQVS
jgi:hypothetical protein